MASGRAHRQMTFNVLREFRFRERAMELAADANAAVDDAENQGSDASKANLHAMRGFAVIARQHDGDGGSAYDLRLPRMQTVEEARREVALLLERRKERILEHVRASRLRAAIDELGAALHTVQDREYHRFEPWPYNGVLASFTSPNLGALYGLSSNYMLCHSVRDLGWQQGPLSLGISYFDFGGHATGSGSYGWVQAEVTQVSSNPWVPHVSLGGGVSFGSGGTEGLGYALLTWGRVPGSDGPRVPPRSGPLTLGTQPGSLCPEASQGAESLLLGTRATRQWVSQLQQCFDDPSDWNRLVAFAP